MSTRQNPLLASCVYFDRQRFALGAATDPAGARSPGQLFAHGREQQLAEGALDRPLELLHLLHVQLGTSRAHGTGAFDQGIATACRSAPRFAVAGIRGNVRNSSRIRGSNASASDPVAARTYLGGPKLATAAFTVFREHPTTRGCRRHV
jgi:hypothetical protein